MTNNIYPNHPDITENMWDQIDVIINDNKNVEGSVISVLRLSQDIVGYLPIELIDFIADGLKLPRSQTYGVTTFYSFFSLKPKGRNLIKVCTGTACYVKGIQTVVDKICDQYSVDPEGTTEDRRFSLNSIRCLGACGLAPVMVVNEDIYGDVKPNESIEIIEKYK